VRLGDHFASLLIAHRELELGQIFGQSWPQPEIRLALKIELRPDVGIRNRLLPQIWLLGQRYRHVVHA
jgi:hypothetical protein